MNNIDAYNRLIKKSFKSKKIKTFVPSPTEADYTRGYINRYFCRKTNNDSSPILEVDSNVFLSMSSNSEYRTVLVRWRISGNEKDVRKSNSVSLKISSEKIKNISLYLPNLLQFHK